MSRDRSRALRTSEKLRCGHRALLINNKPMVLKASTMQHQWPTSQIAESQM
jgi:hypothetical protein